jgi:PhnB protein
MAQPGKPIPDGMHTVTPGLSCKHAAAEIRFCEQAFGATELRRALALDGKKLIHAEIAVGNSVIFLADDLGMGGGSLPPAKLGGTTGALHIYTEDVDALFARAVAAGAKVRVRDDGEASNTKGRAWRPFVPWS